MNILDRVLPDEKTRVARDRRKLAIEKQKSEVEIARMNLEAQKTEARAKLAKAQDKLKSVKGARVGGSSFSFAWLLAHKKLVYLGVLGLVLLFGLIRIIATGS